MAIIANGQKFLTSAPEVNTTYGGPDSLKELNTWYTLEDIAESITTPAPYKVYTARISQSGTNAPVALVLENTLGVTVSFTRLSAGQYKVVLSSNIITLNNCVAIIGNAPAGPTNFNIYCDIGGLPAEIIFTTNALTSGGGYTAGLSDNILYNTFIEIRVY